MADTNILQATVELKIDSTSVDKQIKITSDKLSKSLKDIDKKASTNTNNAVNAKIKDIGRQLDRAGEKLGRVLERGLKIGLGAGTSAIYAFLKSGTPEALRFAQSLDRIKAAWSKVGSTLATKIKIGGSTGQEWIDKLVEKLENLDTAQIEKALNYFKAMAAVWATIKTAQFLGGLAQFANNINQLKNSLASSSIGSSIKNAVSNISNKIPPVLPGRTSISEIGTLAAAGTAGAAGASSIVARRVGRGYMRALEAGTGDRYLEQLRAQKTAIKTLYNAEKGGRAISSTLGGLARNIPFVGSIGAEVGFQGLQNYISGEDISKNMFGYGKGTAIEAGAFKGGGAALGAAIGTAIAPGIGTMIGGAIGYLSTSTIWESLLDVKAIETDSKEVGIRKAKELEQNIKALNLFRSLSSDRKMTEDLMKGFKIDTRRFIGGELPEDLSREYVKYIDRYIKINEKNLKLLEEEYNLLDDAGQKFDTVLKPQIDSLNSTLDNLYNIQDNLLLDLKKRFEKVIDYLEEDIGIEEAPEMSKIEFRKALEKIDQQMADNILAYDMYAQKVLDEQPKALRTSISMGGDIASIPALISQSISDIQNTEQQAQLEELQKANDLEEKAGEMMEKQFELEQERDRLQKEQDERMLKILTPISKTLQRIETNLIGSSTVNFIGYNTATI